MTTTATRKPPTSVGLRGRWLHPVAWWLWALGLATAASRTTNPALLVLIVVVAGTVVAARRPQAPWSRSFGVFLRLGLIIVAIRVVFQVVFGLPQGTTVLFTLPTVDLPDWLAGVRLGGSITAESLVFALYDGLRLATVLACLGAASSLASPYRLLKAMPAALYEVGVSVVVALSFAPALVTDLQRVRTARRLRGRPTSGIRGLTGSAMPVFSGALDRSIALAAAMDSRGYGRMADLSPRDRRITAALVLGGLLGTCLGLYVLLDGSIAAPAGLPVFLLGLAAALLGLLRGGRRNTRTRYRPDPWRTPEWITAASGCAAAAAAVVQGIVDPSALNPAVTPMTWPQVPIIAVVGTLIALLPAWLTPEPPGIVRSGSASDTSTTSPETGVAV
ncbi:MAG: energy-coupling factor transporter transmembrane protein EcfT [Actinobacteria bacterium]|nr:energy-coupling factor transporter transmembrane protein EcfT [Actinomycetota bacterium]